MNSDPIWGSFTLKSNQNGDWYEVEFKPDHDQIWSPQPKGRWGGGPHARPAIDGTLRVYEEIRNKPEIPTSDEIGATPMKSDTRCYLSLQDLSAQLRTGKVSSVEVTRCILDRIQRMNRRLHAYLTVLEESALYRAAQVDEEIRAGHWRRRLHGVPIAIKNLCQTKGVLTTCASRILRDWRPDSSATVVERLKEVGAVLVGKLNLTEFATFWLCLLKT
jgi:hypothetical protein